MAQECTACSRTADFQPTRVLSASRARRITGPDNTFRNRAARWIPSSLDARAPASSSPNRVGPSNRADAASSALRCATRVTDARRLSLL
ncbi:uncharacterized protein SCHCODRAFT_02229703 [Schizophyllum commune H4-8]|uniref:uncharacterized protein n=1 Tax=Schizophyllum commune (strain H4-8 / FGSC 9210) TaxID=578458 RepID=UPI00215F4ADC|nr:uncharacterized protein SCHCODRAFT_02229703 [Schizophyllum commune H4-8]KAI5895369.1 hypothetical protein SCHCODRAFT_02229703 [Schizophyllum commune H4-8]